MRAEPRPATIPEIWAATAGRYGDRTGYRQGGEGFSWAEVQARAIDFGVGIIGLGLAHGDRVAIVAENSVDWIVACVGAMAAGGVVVPVYAALKPAEAAGQVNHADCRFLVASAETIASLRDAVSCVETFISMDDAGGGPGETAFAAVIERGKADGRAALDAAAPSSDDLAAIIFTSGTTGGAKGVMLSHRNLVSNAMGVLDVLDIDGADSVLVVLPLHHAMPLIATIVIVPLIGARAVIENDLRRIRERLASEKPTVFFGVPALYEVIYRNILARAEAEGRLRLVQLLQRLVTVAKAITGVNIGPLVFRSVHHALGGKLRFLVSGGAALKQETAASFFSLGLPLLQGWGMTEASPVVAIQRFSSRRFRFSRYYEKHAGSVGQALPGVEVRLVDVPDKGISVAASGEGEVFVRGKNVFQGYWRSAEETAAAKEGEWLRTGDLARIDGEGNIFLTGRSKYIIVLDSGEKVYPDELEEHLAASALLADVCVMGTKQRDRASVTAVIYPDPEKAGEIASEGGLRGLVDAEVARLCRDLVGYKRVTTVVLRDTPLPRTVLQKVARGQVDPATVFSFEKWRDGGEVA